MNWLEKNKGYVIAFGALFGLLVAGTIVYVKAGGSAGHVTYRELLHLPTGMGIAAILAGCISICERKWWKRKLPGILLYFIPPLIVMLIACGQEMHDLWTNPSGTPTGWFKSIVDIAFWTLGALFQMWHGFRMCGRYAEARESGNFL